MPLLLFEATEMLTKIVQISANSRRRPRTLWGALCVAVACGLLGLNATAAAPQVSQPGQNAEIDAQMIGYPSGSFNIRAYLAKPRSGAKFPAVILVHSVQGLNDRLQDTARQLAAEGFLVLAPDLLSRSTAAGTPPARGAVARLSATATVDDLKAGYDFLVKNPDVDASKISIVGFGWGGWRSFMLAENVPGLFRVVIYYGVTPSTGLENIHAPVLGHYAQYDFRNTGNAIPTEKTMKELGGKFTYYVYPETRAEFVNSSDQHNIDATKLSWQRTISFLRSPS